MNFTIVFSLNLINLKQNLEKMSMVYCGKEGFKSSRPINLGRQTSPFSNKSTAILAIALDSLNDLESSDAFPYMLVFSTGDIDVKFCKFEDRKIKISAPKARKVLITYNTFSIRDTALTGSVIAEMENYSGVFSHELREDATMLGTVYLSN
ncbi:hypothetical protein pv_107 [Pithovirus sibericum]|uniref:Uncharacterized protein n=1 Tax=Pithovirus sibericum TaxID=1450746 RepID=W5S4U9_9VIRU|nr:hypothetical protein pv_107 [Pithovirus sibericum]AHH01674.1 hypothetical protein pv_107 [Pithovirus sibericum]WIL05241.1 hypothetical protein pmam_202 [Pithovirus mammoth]